MLVVVVVPEVEDLREENEKDRVVLGGRVAGVAEKVEENVAAAGEAAAPPRCKEFEIDAGRACWGSSSRHAVVVEVSSAKVQVVRRPFMVCGRA